MLVTSVGQQNEGLMFTSSRRECGSLGNTKAIVHDDNNTATDAARSSLSTGSWEIPHVPYLPRAPITLCGEASLLSPRTRANTLSVRGHTAADRLWPFVRQPLLPSRQLTLLFRESRARQPREDESWLCPFLPT